jgi:hypothetical protein
MMYEKDSHLIAEAFQCLYYIRPKCNVSTVKHRKRFTFLNHDNQ